MSNIFVTNHTDKTHKDGYGGVFYVFEPNKTVEIPVEVARHIFGYGEDNKEPYLARLGWIVTSNDLDKGLEILLNGIYLPNHQKRTNRYPRWWKEYPCPLKRQGEKSFKR